MRQNPDDVNLRAAHARLVQKGLLRPVAETEAEGTRFRDCDLACLLENRRGETLDGLKLNASLRARAETGLADDETLLMPHQTPAMGTAFWILDGKDVAGTVVFTHRLIGAPWMYVSSLYVRPAFRGRGLATRVVREAFAEAVAVGANGLHIGTQWAWQEAVAYYLRLGCWVCNWRRDIAFVMDSTLPACRVTVDDKTARFLVTHQGQEHLLFTATNLGERLGWESHAPRESWEDWDAMMTFSVHLAVRGWPLIRSDAAWQAQCDLGNSDNGPPEGLAWKIGYFEAWERQRGFNVRAPRIPGLPTLPPETYFPAL